MSLFPPSVEYAIAGVPRSRYSKIYVVDSLYGNNSNQGTKWDQPLLSIDAAFAKVVSLHNDIILLVGNGTSYATAAQLAWNASYAHLIGLSADGLMEPRTRIKCPAALATTPFVLWSGSGCVVKNISFWHETSNAAGLVNVSLTGGRNYFENCQFAGAVGANAITGARSLLISGANGGNTFKHCVIGNDTIVVPDGAAGVEFVTGAMHNLFEDCIFNIETNGTTYVHVLAAAAAGVGRLNMFKRCVFINEGAGVEANVFGITAALPISSNIYALDCWKYGATKWDGANNGLFTNGEYPTSISGINTSAAILKTSG
jgi:hypothetical protein